VFQARLRIIAAAALFSTGGAAIKACSLTALQVASLRSGIAAVTLLILMPSTRRRWSWRTVVVGAAYAATMILFVQANKLTTAASAIFLQSTAPLYLLVLGPWLLREPVRRRDVVFMAALGAGLALFFVGVDPGGASAPAPMTGNIFGLLCGVSWALTVTGLRWAARGEGVSGPDGATTAALMVFAGNTIACVVCLPGALPLPVASLADVATVLYLGVFQIGVAYILLTGGMKHVVALEASLLLLVEPVLNPVWAWLVQHETPGPWTLAGGGIIIGATALKTWSDARGLRALQRPAA